MQDPLQTLHIQYERLTGLSLKYSMHHRFYWERWTAEGFTQCDLTDVVAYIRKRIREQKRGVEALRFRLLIEDTARFADELSMAKATSRTPRIDPRRASVLRATGRPESGPERPRANPEHVKDVVAKCLAQMREDIR